MGDFHPAVEQYLETVMELEESGIPPLRARLVERLGVSAPAVSETVARLEREGYLHLDERRLVHLTESGRHLATAVMRRHRLAERLLVDVLRVPWHQVHEEAGRLEHAISDNLESHLIALLGDPATCPHGNPIPGSANTVEHGPLAALADLPPGSTATVRRIDEEIEAIGEFMLLLERGGLLPGATLSVLAPGGDSVRVRTVGDGGRESLLPTRVAAKVYASTG